MRILIVEDEPLAATRLEKLILKINPNVIISDKLTSVEETIRWFEENSEPDLLFLDVQLADGTCFEIIDHVMIECPVIFTTAYDQYALKAFKVNSIDYLLKPIDDEELRASIEKFKNQEKPTDIDSQLKGLLSLIKPETPNYKKTYLVHFQNELIPVKTEEFAYFYMDAGMVKGRTLSNSVYTLDKKLEDLEDDLDPTQFFRVNRQYVVNKEAIVSISFYFNGKLTVKVKPPSQERIVVSKAKASELKRWMNS